jgi:hypothetical protein
VWRFAEVILGIQAFHTCAKLLMLYGMKVWVPSSRNFMQLRDAACADAFSGVDEIVHKALKHVVGLWGATCL